MIWLYIIWLIIWVWLSVILLLLVWAIALDYVDKKILNKKK